jgi:WD40 repeat protein
MTHRLGVSTVSFSPDGSRVLTTSTDRTARVWDVQTGQPVGEPMTHGGAVNSASFSPDGTRVVTASRDNTARVWNALWPSVSRSRTLLSEVCARKLRGEARKITQADVLASPVLTTARIGEDVCEGIPPASTP